MIEYMKAAKTNKLQKSFLNMKTKLDK